jgi:serine protease Do
MKAKYPIGLLSALILTAGIALAQQPATPPEAPEPPEDTIGDFSVLIEGGAFLGVYAENISRENMGRYGVSQVRGVGVTQVVKDSPAEKAGLRKDDVILRLDGENVSSVRKLNRLVSELSPDQSVKVTISRGGSEQEVTATIGRRNNMNMAKDWFGGEPKVFKWDGPELKNFKWETPLSRQKLPNFGNDGNFSLYLSNSRRIGVSTMSLTKQLADFFGIADGKGALVTSVIEDGPAAKAGVKAGDVITAVDGEAVDSPGDISRVINRKKEGAVTLTIIRNKSQQTIQVTPNEGGGGGTLGNPQIGRRIVIPRIEIPAISDVDIAMPNIVIPSIPAINIQLPRIRVMPRVRARGPQGPI